MEISQKLNNILKKACLITYSLYGALYLSTVVGHIPSKEEPIPEVPLETVEEIYGYENVHLTEFNELDFDDLSTEQVKVPSDLETELENSKDGQYLPIENEFTFNQTIYETAEKLGYQKSDLQYLEPKEAVLLTLQIVRETLDYKLVDRPFLEEEGIKKLNPDFLPVYQTPIDTYFHMAIGDCDKFSGLVMYIFDLMKKINPNLANIYIANEDLGGNRDAPHSWNSIVLMFGDKIEVAHVEPQFFSETCEFQNKCLTPSDYYVNSNTFDFELMYSLNDFDSAVENAEETYETIESREEKARFLKELTHSYNHSSLPNKKEGIMMVDQLYQDDELDDYVKPYIPILASVIAFQITEGEIDKAQDSLNKLESYCVNLMDYENGKDIETNDFNYCKHKVNFFKIKYPELK